MAKLLFFGKLADFAGGRERSLELDDQIISIENLIQAIFEDDKILGDALSQPSVRYVRNQEISDKQAAIENSDEIAFLPPVSGG